MSAGVKIVIGIVVLAAIGAAGFFILNKDASNGSSTASQQKNTAGTSPAEEQQSEETSQAITIDDAIATANISCTSSGATESSCTFKGKEYTLTKPTDWDKDKELRKQACDQGYINSNYQILTGSNSFYFSTDYNEDLKTLSKALNDAGADVSLAAYCE